MEVRTMTNSSTTTEAGLIEPIPPGEILMEDVIEGFGITQNKLAVSIRVPPRRINQIVYGKRGITADTAIRLARYFGTSEEFWMNPQPNYELRLERRVLREKVAAITPPEAAQPAPRSRTRWTSASMMRSRRSRTMSGTAS
jgi:antitoxin HigA-1